MDTYEIRLLVEKVVANMDIDAIYQIVEDHLTDYYAKEAGDWEIEDLIEEVAEMEKD